MTDRSPTPSAIAATRKDWRYEYLRVSDVRRKAAGVLSSDITTAMGRVESCLTDIACRGSAGAWLENESLLAVRFVLETLRVASVPAEGGETTDPQLLDSDTEYETLHMGEPCERCGNRMDRIATPGGWTSLCRVCPIGLPSAVEGPAPDVWTGFWGDWIAPFHACPRCGTSLNWTRHEDVFEHPVITTSCCGVNFGAPLQWSRP